MRKTNEGGTQYEHSLDHGVEFFSKAGSLRANKDSFYHEDETALSLFQKIWIVEKPLAVKLMLWLRDCRGGAGNRSGARECYKWLAKEAPEWLSANLHWLPVVGRWDDLRYLFGSAIEKDVAAFWANAITRGEVLAAKWADRKDYPLRNLLGLKVGDFRRLLSQTRRDHIVEHKMCHHLWKEVDYEKVPSVAMARYTKAFGKHDQERFEKFKAALASGEAAIHADVLFPHDCVRTSRYGDKAIADAQFDALPNYMEEADERIVTIADTSGSMSCIIGGSVQAVDVSIGMALYCSAKIPEDNPFHKKFIAFCSEGEFKDWNGMKFSEAVSNRKIFNGAIGSTRIDKALDLILESAKFFNLTEDQIPTMLLIVSDMQFHSPGRYHGSAGDGSEVEKCLARWEKAGYKMPKVVYWNTDGYAGSPATVKSKNVGLVSGFSPATLKSIFGGDNLTPRGIMLKALEKYEIVIP